MAFVIAPHLRARIRDAAGRSFEAASRMTQREIDHCRRCFRDFQDLVFTYTGGALRIEATEVILDEAVTTLSSTGPGRYWLSAHDALRGREDLIPRDELDGLGVYYKMPAGVTPALHGGAVGRDHGVRGTAFWTLWIADWSERPGPLSRTAIASLHEWLHNVSFYAHRVMGETAIPDCHAGEEYGYWDTDGGYRQWMAWNRDLMLRYIPREFWYRLTSRGPLLPPESLGPVFSIARWWTSVRRGVPLRGLGRRAYRCDEVSGDWMRRLPVLRDRDLRSVTRLPDLSLALVQPGPNTPVVWALQTRAAVDSPYEAGDPLHAPPRLDNVLGLGRLSSPSPVGGGRSAYLRAPLESMAWIRSPRAPRPRRDLLLLRPDVAPWILERLHVAGRPAAECLLGYVARRDPSEGQRVNLLVAAVDLGDPLPTTELEAVRV